MNPIVVAISMLLMIGCQSPSGKKRSSNEAPAQQINQDVQSQQDLEQAFSQNWQQISPDNSAATLFNWSSFSDARIDAMVRLLFRVVDSDGSGSLSLDEFYRWDAIAPEQNGILTWRERFFNWAAGGDGLLDPSEAADGIRRIGDLTAQVQNQLQDVRNISGWVNIGWGEILSRYDSDNDAVLNAVERDAMFADIRERYDDNKLTCVESPDDKRCKILGVIDRTCESTDQYFAELLCGELHSEQE